MSSYVVIHWSGISSSNILWLHSTSQSVLHFIWRVQWEYSHAHCPLAGKAFKWRWLFTTTNRKQDCFCPQYCWTSGKESTLLRRAAKCALSSARRGRERVESCPDWLKLLRNDVHINKPGKSPSTSRWSKSVPSHPDDHMDPPLPMPSWCEFLGINPMFILQFLRDSSVCWVRLKVCE